MIEFTHIRTYIDERAHTQARGLDGTRKIELQEEAIYFYCVILPVEVINTYMSVHALNTDTLTQRHMQWNATCT